MKNPSKAHSPRLNRNVNIILNNYICCIDCRIGLSTINDLAILDIHRCKITKDYRKRKATCLLLLIGNERWTRCSSPLSFISLIHNPLILHSVFFLSRALNNLSHLYYPPYHFRDVFLCFKFYLLQKRCSLNVLNMILETPNFKVTNIIFESYEHRSKIILQLLTSFVFLKVGFVPHRRNYS